MSWMPDKRILRTSLGASRWCRELEKRTCGVFGASFLDGELLPLDADGQRCCAACLERNQKEVSK